MSECFHVKFSFSGFIVLKDKIFKWPHPFLTFLWLSRVWRGPDPFIWTNLNSLHQRIICTKFDWCRLVLEKIFQNFLCISTLSISSPLKGGHPLLLNTLESSPSKDDLCQVWLKLVQWFWRKRFLNDATQFLHFCDYLPFEEDLAVYLKKLKFASPKDNLY
jgi:hypothetical protein